MKKMGWKLRVGYNKLKAQERMANAREPAKLKRLQELSLTPFLGISEKVDISKTKKKESAITGFDTIN